MPEPRLCAEVDIDVPFFDVDSMHIVWHGNYVKYFEIGRCALLRLIGYDYPEMAAGGYLWPIVDCRLRYVRPARYGQRIRVKASLLEWENRLRIAYEIRDCESGERLTRGETVQVAVEAASQAMQFVSPPDLVERVRAKCGNC
ncbi:MAG: acyl-CoA thioesterase [Rhodocyclaceae bacterium]|nr:acyl-CoA thioesterase [Rhodocyclaceae bacterium]